jgi:AAHS family 4-hydroxybenzoate transporter-like MFS transporter
VQIEKQEVSGRAVVNVPELIDRHPIGRFQIAIVALCALVIFVDGFDNQVIGYVAPAIIKAWRLHPQQLAPIFSAGLFGTMLGALFLGPLADLAGRRRLIIWSTALCSAFTLASAGVHTIEGLLILRFLTGLTLGGTNTNLVALTAEYGPRQSRSKLVMLMVCGLPFGSAIGGTVAAQVIPRYGWASAFIIVGSVMLTLALVAALFLPESIPFLALRREDEENKRIEGLVKRLYPQVPIEKDTIFVVDEQKKADVFTVKYLFQAGRTPLTLLLWFLSFMNLLTLYFLINWLPTVISMAGQSIQRSILATSGFQFAGILCTLIIAYRFLKRFNPTVILGSLYAVGSVFVALIGYSAFSPTLIVLTLLIAGFCIIGGQNMMNAVEASAYPTFIRSTGVGWAVGIGRIGSIAGPLIGGLMLSYHWRVQSFFLAASVATIFSSLAAFRLASLTRDNPSLSQPS